ncbi:MAG: MarR family transcriptional regulator [Bacillota bacterium]|nr:MarR family transcriptional regulator [Bacillota bacterium]
MAKYESNDIYLAGDLLRQLFDKYNRLENKKYLYKDLKDLTLIEINTIIVIGCEGLKSMSQIANELGVTFGTPTVTIDRLITKNLVERIRDEGDRRQVFVKLSEDGKKIYNAVSELKKKVTEKVFEVLSDDEKILLIGVLSKLNNKFNDLFSDI